MPTYHRVFPRISDLDPRIDHSVPDIKQASGTVVVEHLMENHKTETS